MKNINLKHILPISVLFFCQTGFSQGNDAGIKILSGSKVLYQDLSILKQVVDEFYFEKFTELTDKTLAYVKKEAKDPAFVKGTRAERIHLCKTPEMEIFEDGGKVKIRYLLKNNRIFFHATTYQNIGFDASSANDPMCVIIYTMSITMDVLNGEELTDLRTRKGPWVCNIEKSSVSNDESHKNTGETIKGWFDYSFAYGISPVYFSLNDLGNTINKLFEDKVRNNQKLLDEMSIDENQKLELKADAVNNLLILQHPHSYAGSMKRNPTKPAEIGKAPAIITTDSVSKYGKTKITQGDLNKPAAAITPTKGLKTPVKKY